MIIRRVSPLRPGWMPVGLLCGMAALATGAGPDEKPTPESVIRQVTDFYGKAKAFRVDDTRTIKAGPAPIKQVSTVAVEQPNKLALRTEEAGSPVVIVSDGKAMNITLGPIKKYVQGKPLTSFGSLGDDPITKAIVMGALNGSLIAEMIAPDPYKNVMDGVTGSTYVGLEDVDGVKAHHVKFVQGQMDWEAWVAAKGDPLLVKTVTDLTKSVPDNMKSMKPELIHNFKNWKFDTKLDAKAFAYEPPAGYAKAKSLQEALGGGAGGGGGGGEEPRSELIGKPAPAMALKTLEGGKFTLADYKDKSIVLVDFWATWCGPCVMELPLLVEVADAFKDKGLVFRAVDLRENAEKVNKFQADKKLKFPVAFDADGAIGKAYNVSGIPTCVLIDKSGTVRAVHVGYNPKIKDELMGEIEALLAGKSLGEKADADADADGKKAP